MLRKILIILAIVVPLGFLIWAGIKAKDIWDKISFTPYVKAIDLKGKTWNDLIQSIGSLLGLSESDLDIVTMGVDIKNDSNLSIPISGFNMKLFYPVTKNSLGKITDLGTEVASTSPELAAQKIVIAKKATTSISDKIHLYLNQQAGQLITEGAKKNKPEVGYKLNMKVFGIPIPERFLTGTFNWDY